MDQGEWGEGGREKGQVVVTNEKAVRGKKHGRTLGEDLKPSRLMNADQSG